jgi:ferritin
LEEVNAMLNKEIEGALNDQINAEIYSSYLYLSMASYFESLSLPGFSNWFKIQAQEELTHAMKFFDFISERGGRVQLKPIEGPPTEWESPLSAFEAAYKHEVHVTDRINKLVDLSIKLSDHAANTLLQWFVSEQVEEEATADEIVQHLKLVKGEGQGLFMIDRELGQRVFTIPAATGEA